MLSDTRTPCDDALSGPMAADFDCGNRTGKWVLAAAVLGSGITFIDGTVVNVALPVIQRELGTDVAETQWIIESYALMLSALILVGGSLGDRLGRRKIFSLGVLIFAAASAGCGLAPNASALIIARGVQGIGAALLVPGSLALISANFSRERRGRAIGTWSGLTAIAAGIGPVLGGWLVEMFSWRWIFFINVPLAVAVLVISAFHVPESKDKTVVGKIDVPGASLATIGLGGIVFGVIESNSRSLYDPAVIVSFIAGISAIAGFIAIEMRSKYPMMPLSLFRSPAFAGANLLTLFLYAGLGGLLFFLPFSLIQIHGYEPTAAGAALVPFVVTMFVLSRWAGGLVDRYGSKIPLVAGPIVAACGFALFAIPGADAGSYWTSFFPAVMLMSVGMAVSVAPLTTTVMSAVDESRAGTASGINNAVSRTAGLIAVAIFGVLLLSVFKGDMAVRLTEIGMSADVRSAIMQKSNELAAMPIPDTLAFSDRESVGSAIRESFVSGFRYVALIAALLAALSSFFAWVLIPGRSAATKRV